jgi:hypothetical protein
MSWNTIISKYFFIGALVLCASPQVLEAHTAENSLTLTAQAMACDVQTVKDVKALNLDCTLSWILMRLCATSDAKVARILDERATRSWGEVCALHGRSWGDLVQEVLQRKRAFGLSVEPSSNLKTLRSASNHPDTQSDRAPQP